MRRFAIAWLPGLVVFAAACLAAEPDGISIDAGFPAGNIVVQRIEGDDAFVRQDLRDTSGWWF